MEIIGNAKLVITNDKVKVWGEHGIKNFDRSKLEWEYEFYQSFRNIGDQKSFSEFAVAYYNDMHVNLKDIDDGRKDLPMYVSTRSLHNSDGEYFG